MELKTFTKTCVAITALVFVVCASLTAWMLYDKAQYKPPAFEENVAEGLPQLSEEEKVNYGYSPLNLSEKISVYVCGTPRLDAESVDLYVTNPEENNAWIMCEIFSSDGESIGKSGIIKQGLYLKSLNKTKQILDDDKLTVKIYFFEPDTYYSAGQTITLNIDLDEQMEGE